MPKDTATTNLHDHIRIARRFHVAMDSLADLANTIELCHIPKAKLYAETVRKAASTIARRISFLDRRMFNQHPELGDEWKRLYFGTLEDVGQLEKQLEP